MNCALGSDFRVKDMETGYLRGACEINWRDRWSSKKVRRQCGVKVDLIGSIKSENVLGWCGHTVSVDIGRIAKILHRNDVVANRRGKPRIRWKGKMWKYLGTRGIRWEEGMRIAGERQNRNLFMSWPLTAIRI